MAYRTAHIRGRDQIYGIIRRMNKGLILGFLVIVSGPLIGYMVWRPLKQVLYAMGICLLLLSLGYQVQAWRRIRQMEKNGQAEVLYRQLEEDCSAFPPVNCLLTQDYLVSVGGRSGLEILRLEQMETITEYRHYQKKGDNRELRVVMEGDGQSHIVAFIRTPGSAQEFYDAFLPVLKKHAKHATYHMEEAKGPRTFLRQK